MFVTLLIISSPAPLEVLEVLARQEMIDESHVDRALDERESQIPMLEPLPEFPEELERLLAQMAIREDEFEMKHPTREVSFHAQLAAKAQARAWRGPKKARRTHNPGPRRATHRRLIY